MSLLEMLGLKNDEYSSHKSAYRREPKSMGCLFFVGFMFYSFFILALYWTKYLLPLYIISWTLVQVFPSLEPVQWNLLGMAFSYLFLDFLLQAMGNKYAELLVDFGWDK